MIQTAEEYLDKQFPKGDKRRGEAMVLLALAQLKERKIISHLNRYCKDCSDLKLIIKEIK